MITATAALAHPAVAPWAPAGPAGPMGFHPFFPFFLLIPVFWIVVIGAIVLIAVRGRRRFAATYGPGSGRDAERTLAERFAQGDIEEQEYRARLEVLRANRLPSR